MLQAARVFHPAGHFMDIITLYRGAVLHTYFYIEGRGWTSIKPFELATNLDAQEKGIWTEIQVDADRRLLEPTQEYLINHGLIGSSPSDARIYERYPSGVTIKQVYDLTDIGTDYGYFDGLDSPYNNPGPKSEFVSIYKRHPLYAPFNPRPTSGTSMSSVNLNVQMMTYLVTLIDKKGFPKLWQMLYSKERRSYPHVIGGVQRIADAPPWIVGVHKESGTLPDAKTGLATGDMAGGD